MFFKPPDQNPSILPESDPRREKTLCCEASNIPGMTLDSCGADIVEILTFLDRLSEFR